MQREIASYDTVPRWAYYEKKYPPWLFEVIRARRCPLCSVSMGIQGFIKFTHDECERMKERK